MRYSALSFLKNVTKIQTLQNFVFIRQASNGIGLWNETLTNDHKHEIERYWRDKIHKIDENAENKEKYYILSMFPYPSGSLHMGHVRVYTISDTIARFYRMQGKNVIHPMGWDAFGLPAENAAIERGVDPDKWTKLNIEHMRKQLYDLGCTFDTHREFATCDPDYYKWTQELFLKLFERGLLYQKEAFVNWDPIDQTVLADEQVDENNKSWRSGAEVEKKLLRQWFIRTTAFAESLLEGLKDSTLKEWRDVIKLQEHWIGECTGTNIDFQLISEDPGYPKSLMLWTDKPEYIQHVKFVAISANNILAKIERSGKWGNPRKLKAYVINPFNSEKIPIFVTDNERFPFPNFRDSYIGIPCSSELDTDFCKLCNINYEELPIYSAQKRMEKRSEILKIAKEQNIGGFPVSARLRDWLVSRQRYWGTPIPIIHCKKCGPQPVPKEQLPVVLPPLKHTSKQGITLERALHWLETSCPKCKGAATRESDTMDTFVDSSWYFIRYIDPKNDKEMFSKEKAFHYLPVDLYIGGKEHAVLHLYYARFINHFLYHLGLVPTREPFKQLLVQGMVMGQSYCTRDGKYLEPENVWLNDDGIHVNKTTNEPVVTAWEKMSKSKHNGVDPSKLLAEYSTDTIRLLMLADVAPTSHRNWSKDTFPGILNWQRKLFQTVTEFLANRTFLSPEELQPPVDDPKFQAEEASMFDARNYYVHGVTFNVTASQQLSIAISKMQGLTNDLKRASKQCIARSREYERALGVQIIMLAPLAPHFASELWSGFCKAPHRMVNDGEFNWEKDVLEQRWPEVDMEYKLKLKVKVNNKEFLLLRVSRRDLETMNEFELTRLVTAEPKFQKHLDKGRIITKVLHLPVRGGGARLSITTRKNVVSEMQEEAI